MHCGKQSQQGNQTERQHLKQTIYDSAGDLWIGGKRNDFQGSRLPDLEARKQSATRDGGVETKHIYMPDGEPRCRRGTFRARGKHRLAAFFWRYGDEAWRAVAC